MGKTVAKIIAYVFIALALVALVGLIYKYTNGFNEDFKTFYVEYDGKQILTAESKLSLIKGKTHSFNVKYTFDNEKSEPKDYKVKVVPNVTRDFDYTVNGEKYLYSKTGELTAAFGLKKEQTQFSLTLSADFNLQNALSSVNGGKAVTVPDDAETNNPYPYRLTVSSYNEKVTFHIDLKLVDVGVKDITVNPDEIIFGGGDKTETPETPTNPREYNIGYLTGGDGTNLTNYSVDGPTSATAGETVTFYVTVYDTDYEITGFYVYAFGVQTKPEIATVNGGYQFTMPNCNVDIRIDLKYTAVTDEPTYRLEYDSLGWASMSVVNLNCPDRAAAGESVTFTARIKTAYASEYEITHIVVQLGSGEAYIEDLQGNNGSYTFTMPDAATMDAEVNEGYVTLMFYIMPVN